MRNAKIFSRNAKISQNFWCLLVVLKSIFIFCVNPLIGLADKLLFETDSCILKILSCLMNFRTFFAKIFLLFLKYCIFWDIFLFRIISFFSRNFRIIFLRANEMRKWSKMVAKEFFLFAGNPSCVANYRMIRMSFESLHVYTL